MESKGGSESCEAYPMNSGDGEYSYAQRSTLQRNGADLAKNMIKEAILDKLDIETLPFHSSNAFSIADLGCSIGPNTFFSVQNIIESVNLKLQSHGYDLTTLEFHAFFNDHVYNDFNTLFKSLPVDKQYYVAGVPGSFHTRLFPKSTLRFVYSSYALHWLSKVPKEVLDKHSPAYNKGKIYFANAPKEAAQAFSAQFARDFECFLNARALELFPGGLMAFIIPCIPPNVKTKFTAIADCLGDALVDMASKGLVSDDLVDSFNMPLYTPTSEELKVLIEKNGDFNIEKMEEIARPSTHAIEEDVNSTIMIMRAGWEGIVKQHFGDEIVDQVFEQFKKKLAESSFLTDSSYQHMKEMFFLVKRKYV